MTQFGIFSDIHLDFKDWDFVEEPGVHYINAGDICHSWARSNKFNSAHPNVMTITGNHDYYGDYALPWLHAPYHIYRWEVDGLIIKGATLWTDFKTSEDYWRYTRTLNDSRCIYGMNYNSYKQTHEIHKEFLLKGDADIIVMHHAPSSISIAPRFRNSAGNEFFHNELDEEIKLMTKKPKLIIHGHMHDPCDYMIGETRVICHPRGYPGETTYYNQYEPKIVEL